MAKRNQKGHVTRFFQSSDPYDPIDNILSEVGNQIVSLGMKKLSKEAARLLGLDGMSVADDIQLQRLRLSVAKQEGENTRASLIGERQLKLLDIKLQEKEIAIQEKKRLLETAQEEKARLALPEAEMVVDGALTIPQDKGGIVFPDEPEGYQDWLDSLPYGKVILILGSRGSGKTSLGARIAEFISATYGMSIFWLGLPEAARNLLPSWVKLVSSPEQCPSDSVIIADEAGLRFSSLAFQADPNRILRQLLMVVRHRRSTLIFATQSSRDVENSVVRQSDCFCFKRPGRHQAASERPDVRGMAKKAAEVFEKIPKEKQSSSTLVFDDAFQGVITTTLPSFWSEELSHIYRHIDLGQIETQGKRVKELEQVVTEETKLLDATTREKEIMELRRQGCGIEKIAGILKISTWQVRKCLGSSE